MTGVKKAVFPVAGIGSRFLPATKVSPKEILPIVDKPLIQYAVEEAIRAGITHMIFIINSTKHAIEDHFDRDIELETLLHEQGKSHLADLVRQVSPPDIQFTYVRQPQALGLGHAILCAEHVVGNEAFAVILPDDLINDYTMPCLSSMTDFFQQQQQSILAVQSVAWLNVHQYGIVNVDNQSNSFSKIHEIIEKPEREFAPSNLAAIGRYVFTSTIFKHLKQTPVDKHQEIQLTGAIQGLIAEENVFAYKFLGKRYDCGSKLGYLKATVEFGLDHPELGREFAEYLRGNHT